MLGAEGLLKSVIFWGLQHVPRLLLVSCTVWSMKMTNPELVFYISGMWTIKGDVEGMDFLIPRTRSWINSLQGFFSIWPLEKQVWVGPKLSACISCTGHWPCCWKDNNYWDSVVAARESYKTGLCKNFFPQVTDFQSLYQSTCNSSFKVMEIITNIE